MPRNDDSSGDHRTRAVWQLLRYSGEILRHQDGWGSSLLYMSYHRVSTNRGTLTRWTLALQLRAAGINVLLQLDNNDFITFLVEIRHHLIGRLTFGLRSRLFPNPALPYVRDCVPGGPQTRWTLALQLRAAGRNLLLQLDNNDFINFIGEIRHHLIGRLTFGLRSGLFPNPALPYVRDCAPGGPQTRWIMALQVVTAGINLWLLLDHFSQH